MDNFLQQFSVIELAAIAYMALALIKTILVLSNVNVAAGVMQRKLGNHHSIWYYTGLAGALCIVYTFFMVPALLKREKHKFFVVYTDQQVMKEVLAGL